MKARKPLGRRPWPHSPCAGHTDSARQAGTSAGRGPGWVGSPRAGGDPDLKDTVSSRVLTNTSAKKGIKSALGQREMRGAPFWVAPRAVAYPAGGERGASEHTQ